MRQHGPTEGDHTSIMAHACPLLLLVRWLQDLQPLESCQKLRLISDRHASGDYLRHLDGHAWPAQGAQMSAA